ncbi:MAG: hypothetical protein P8P74_11785 [Crocinitomicaceae bacterium]|nr:hypothetical protein [Crocinitomicaceae bacterium]
MRTFIFCVCSLLLISASCEEAVSADPSKEEQLEEVGTRAIVTTDYSDEGCAVLLEIEEEGQKVLLMPIELEEKFKIHGTEVLIEYTLSRIMQGECLKGRPIVIQSIKLVG